jgi:hypothetical protein
MEHLKEFRVATMGNNELYHEAKDSSAVHLLNQFMIIPEELNEELYLTEVLMNVLGNGRYDLFLN